jgi:hypothetical protein
MSIFTAQVNSILDENQTYDPTINFGKGRSQHNLLGYAVANGLYSLPIMFNAIPIMNLTSSTRSSLQNLLK